MLLKLVMPAVAALFTLALAAVFFGEVIRAWIGLRPEILFAAAVFPALGMLMSLGALAGARGRRLRAAMLCGGAVFTLVPILCALLDGAGLNGDPRRWLGLLPGTAVFLLGVLIVPAALMAAALHLFPRSLYGDSDHRRFLNLAQNREPESKGGSRGGSGAED